MAAEIIIASSQAPFHILDPMSLVISENSRCDEHRPFVPLSLRTDPDTYFFVMERGPRYSAYTELREAKLRRKHKKENRTPANSLALSEMAPSSKIGQKGEHVGSSLRRSGSTNGCEKKGSGVMVRKSYGFAEEQLKGLPSSSLVRGMIRRTILRSRPV
ncbi:hypothetical protein SAY86_030669 [Trapa natans]|uniref:Uncharacterized protein n=1 Tax=Trapa natans TaxID=22666 RepID=A0AAN7LY93_TRANT|nr:hypothetical protein SAY86_030669 [Trapa natans]